MQSKIGLLVVLALAATTVAACRTNLLPEYRARLKTAHAVSVAPTGPEVIFGGSEQEARGGVGAALQVMTEIATASVAQEVHRKISEAAAPERFVVRLNEVFAARLPQALAVTLVAQGKDPHDARIEVAINRYGVEAASLEAQVFYFMECEARMIYVPENKLIWEDSKSFRSPIKPVHVTGPGAAIRAQAAAVNFAVLNNLSPDELRSIFMQMAEESGAAFVEQMREDAVAN